MNKSLYFHHLKKEIRCQNCTLYIPRRALIKEAAIRFMVTPKKHQRSMVQKGKDTDRISFNCASHKSCLCTQMSRQRQAEYSKKFNISKTSTTSTCVSTSIKQPTKKQHPQFQHELAVQSIWNKCAQPLPASYQAPPEDPSRQVQVKEQMNHKHKHR